MNKHFRFSGGHFAKMRSLGVSASAGLRRAGLDQAVLSEPRVLLKTEEPPQFERELSEDEGDENFVERVRLVVQQKLTGRHPTIDDIAEALHISSRTLQRRLRDAGFSFRRVLEEARHRLARHYLNDPALELNEAAYLLGYEDGNSFVRAFRTWEGVPPATWREQQRAREAS